MLSLKANRRVLLGDEGPDHPTFLESECLRWAEEDETRYTRALLYAGAEPEVEYEEYYDESGYREHYITPDSRAAHEAWQRQVSEVLMTKYQRWWWYSPERNRSPEYRKRAQQVESNVKREELRKFYTWLCKERREPWTDRVDPL